MAAATELGRLGLGSDRDRGERPGRLPNRLRERGEVVLTGKGRVRIDVETHDFPATRRGQPIGVSVTQVV